MTDTMMIRDCIRSQGMKLGHVAHVLGITCLLYTSDAADERQ